MKFSQAFLDEIRARLPVSEVVARRVKLRKQGREWAGLSPFNAEKTPSFFVNDQKAFFHDFSSGKHGDIFTFVTETEGLSFPEAVERLAAMAGVPMPRQSDAEAEQEKKRASLLDVLAMAERVFEAGLNGPAGARARGYLSDRGLGPAVQQRFSLGYSAPERFALRDALAAKGVGVDQMIEAGLLVHGISVTVHSFPRRRWIASIVTARAMGQPIFPSHPLGRSPTEVRERRLDEPERRVDVCLRIAGQFSSRRRLNAPLMP